MKKIIYVIASIIFLSLVTAVLVFTQYTSITVDGLKDTYQMGESIEFSLLVKGYGIQREIPSLSIKKIDGQEIIWSSLYGSPFEPPVLPRSFETNWHFPTATGVPIRINQTGTYVLKVEAGGQNVQKLFTVN